MKKITATLTAIALALVIAGTAQAGRHRGGMNGGCGDCAQSGVQTEQQRTFHQNTIDLRQDMMLKRFEVQRENLKATPDNAKITALKAEIKGIQAKINEIRIQSGMPDRGLRDGECFQKDGKGRNCGNGQYGDCFGPCNNR
ncbi:MAG: hypothetical protein A2X85_17280 [Geobacteraceae bacterium GWF2_54_21]|nr:MAG: hypothetical protein A2X85_17280 [Geobacteraceae bacterium GWF2_54_21]